MNSRNKGEMTQALKEIWTGNLNVAEDVFAANCIHHFYDQVTGWRINGPRGYRHIVALLRRAFPEARFFFEVEEEDFILIRWQLSGVHKGELMGVEPSGEEVTFTGIDIFRVDHGKVCESWANWDFLGFLERLSRASGEKAGSHLAGAWAG